MCSQVIAISRCNKFAILLFIGNFRVVLLGHDVLLCTAHPCQKASAWFHRWKKYQNS